MTAERIDVERVDLGRPERNEVAPSPRDDDLVLTDHVVFADGKPVLYHAPLGDTAVLDRLGDWIDERFDGWEGFGTNINEARLSGIKNAHRVFGYTGMVPLRRRWGASSSSFNAKWPSAAFVLEKLAEQCAAEFERVLPVEFARHADLVSHIDPGWLLASAPWTSGVMNRTSAMPYHRDGGNVPGSWSAMLTLRRGGHVEGGMLHVRDLGVFLRCGDAALTIFDGQRSTHGVSPFPPDHGDRYSIVFYAKADVGRAAPPGQEIAEAKRRATETADRFVEPT